MSEADLGSVRGTPYGTLITTECGTKTNNSKKDLVFVELLWKVQMTLMGHIWPFTSRVCAWAGRKKFLII